MCSRIADGEPRSDDHRRASAGDENPGTMAKAVEVFRQGTLIELQASDRHEQEEHDEAYRREEADRRAAMMPDGRLVSRQASSSCRRNDCRGGKPFDGRIGAWTTSSTADFHQSATGLSRPRLPTF